MTVLSIDPSLLPRLLAPSKNVDKKGWVYFIRGLDLIKIGTTQKLAARVSQLRSSSPVPLELLLAIRGGRQIEIHLHEKYRSAPSHGEWFHATPELLTHIGRLTRRCTKTVQGPTRSPGTPA